MTKQTASQNLAKFYDNRPSFFVGSIGAPSTMKDPLTPTRLVVVLYLLEKNNALPKLKKPPPFQLG